MSFTLTAGQQAGYAALIKLVTDSTETELVIDGFAGTGKTTLVNVFLDEWPQICKLSGGTFKELPIYITATTNKAADALKGATGREVSTIHSFLGLRVVGTGYRESKLVATEKEVPKEGLVFIDEASFIDEELLKEIKRRRNNCKIIFLGDPCQLKPVNADNTPVFDTGITTVNLTEIVRQSDTSPIQKLSRSLRDFVAGVSDMPLAGVDGINIIHLNQEDFEKRLIEDCIKGSGNSVRALAWTNQKANYYNELVAKSISGNGEIVQGDIAVVNKQVMVGKFKFATDSTVLVAGLSPWVTDNNGIVSRKVETNFGHVLTQAQNILDVGPLIKKAYADDNFKQAYVLENMYADLRLMYASTVNKSQGSTYDTVYIDLSDIGKCKDKDQVRRMMYVSVSRARNKVVFTGDI